MNYKYKTLFDESFETEDQAAKQKYHEKMKELGSVPHFVITKEPDGWFAECQENKGIITGGENPNPTEEEIEEKVKDVLLTAFHISGKSLKQKKLKCPTYGIAYRSAVVN